MIALFLVAEQFGDADDAVARRLRDGGVGVVWATRNARDGARLRARGWPAADVLTYADEPRRIQTFCAGRGVVAGFAYERHASGPEPDLVRAARARFGVLRAIGGSGRLALYDGLRMSGARPTQADHRQAAAAALAALRARARPLDLGAPYALAVLDGAADRPAPYGDGREAVAALARLLPFGWDLRIAFVPGRDRLGADLDALPGSVAVPKQADLAPLMAQAALVMSDSEPACADAVALGAPTLALGAINCPLTLRDEFDPFGLRRGDVAALLHEAALRRERPADDAAIVDWLAFRLAQSVEPDAPDEAARLHLAFMAAHPA